MHEGSRTAPRLLRQALQGQSRWVGLASPHLSAHAWEGCSSSGFQPGLFFLTEQLPGVAFSVSGLQAWDLNPSSFPLWPFCPLLSAAISTLLSKMPTGHALHSPGSLLRHCPQTRSTGRLCFKGVRKEHHGEAGTAKSPCQSLPRTFLRGLGGRACTRQRPSSWLLETQTCRESTSPFWVLRAESPVQGHQGG